MSFLSNKTKQTINKTDDEQSYIELQKLYYDYNQLKDKQLAKWLSNCTIEIRGRQYRSMKEVYQMGKLLNQVKERIGYGYYRDWLNKELIEPGIFGLSTAENYCSVANAVEKFGYEKLKYFAVSALYIAGKTRDTVDEEFQKYIFDEGEKRYITTGEPISKVEVLQEKKRFKAINSSNLPEKQKKELIETKVPIEIVNQIIKHPTTKSQVEVAQKVITINQTTTSDNLNNINISNLTHIRYSEKKSVEVNNNNNVVLIQHSLDREGGDLNEEIKMYCGSTQVLAIITLPKDNYIINIPEGFIVESLVYLRRPRHRLWSDVNLINHLFCVTLLTKNKSPKFPLDDYFDSAEQGIEYILKAFNIDQTKPIIFTRTNAEVVSFNLFPENLITRLSELHLNPLYVIL